MLKGGNKLEKALSDYIGEWDDENTLKAGFLENSTYPDGESLPLVAFTNEYGDPLNNQPPRPFFRNAIAENSNTWSKEIEESIKAGNSLYKSMQLAGEQIVGDIKISINKLTEPKLSPVTIAKKGFDKPLIDTSNMVNSVDYEISKGNKTK